jgi:hypothetical protein
MKKKIIALIIFFYFLNSESPAYAHVLKVDKNIGAVLHIDPDDDPIVGQESGFFFEFKDKENKFKIENCNCIFSITENGKEIYSQNLTSNNTLFTFPEKNVYEVKVNGTPIADNSFQPFSLIYDVRVAREVTNNKPSTINPILILFGSIGLIGLTFIFAHKSAIFKKNDNSKKDINSN